MTQYQVRLYISYSHSTLQYENGYLCEKISTYLADVTIRDSKVVG